MNWNVRSRLFVNSYLATAAARAYAVHHGLSKQYSEGMSKFTYEKTIYILLCDEKIYQ